MQLLHPWNHMEWSCNLWVTPLIPAFCLDLDHHSLVLVVHLVFSPAQCVLIQTTVHQLLCEVLMGDSAESFTEVKVDNILICFPLICQDTHHRGLSNWSSVTSPWWIPPGCYFLVLYVPRNHLWENADILKMKEPPQYTLKCRFQCLK